MATAYPDLPAAMIGWLRSQPTIVAAFGEDTSAPATTKFWADAARQGVALPWAVYEEVDGELAAMTAAGGVTCRIETGLVRFVVVAEGKRAARDLGRMVMKGLDDAPLVFDDGRLMYLRARRPFFAPAGTLAPNSPGASARVVVFETMVQRTV